MQGTFGYELDLSKMTDEEKKMAGEQIAFFKEHGRLFQFGDYYRLTHHLKTETILYGNMRHRMAVRPACLSFIQICMQMQHLRS